MYALFENLESGATVKEFLEWYLDVEEWQVRAVLDHEVEYLKTSQLYREGPFRPRDSGGAAQAPRVSTPWTDPTEKGWELLGNGELIRRAEGGRLRGHRDHRPEHAPPAEPLWDVGWDLWS